MNLLDWYQSHTTILLNLAPTEYIIDSGENSSSGKHVNISNQLPPINRKITILELLENIVRFLIIPPTLKILLSLPITTQNEEGRGEQVSMILWRPNYKT